MKMYQLFFHLLDSDPPNPWGPNEKVITDVEKRERKIRPISLQKEIWEQSLSAFLFVGWLKNIYWWNMNMMLKIHIMFIVSTY